MGIYGALSSAVTGLRAQAHALENISGNIANSQTTGYKRIETDFLDLIPDAPLKRQVPGAVLAQSRGTNNVQGDIKTVSNETYIALNGNGFFVVEPKVGQSDGNAVFAGTNFFTRRGDFNIDKDGMLVNGAGYYLKGLPVDTSTGNISGSVPEVIRISNAFLPAQRTSRINYQANLPQLPKTNSYNATVPDSELLHSRTFDPSIPSANPRIASGATVEAPAATAYASHDDYLTLTKAGSTVRFDFYDDQVGYTGGNSGIALNVWTPPIPAIRSSVAGTASDSLLAEEDPDLSSFDTKSVTLTDENQNEVTFTFGSNPKGQADELEARFEEAGYTVERTSQGLIISREDGFDFRVTSSDADVAALIGIADDHEATGGTPEIEGYSTARDITEVLAEMHGLLPDDWEADIAVIDGKIAVDGNGTRRAPVLVDDGTTGFGITSGTYPYDFPKHARIAHIPASHEADFQAQSISGGAITVYAENGAPANVQLRWAKVDSEAADGEDTWNLFYLSDSAATGSSPMWTNVGQDYVFRSDGSLASPGVASVTIPNLSINGISVGDVELRHELNGVTQFADVNGTVNVSTLNQSGHGAGEFVSVQINDSGRVVATYTNGERIDIAQVVTAQFNATNQLKRLDGGVFSSTSESGEAILDLSGSGIIGGSLEASNTDISEEFSKLIVTQQAYAAGTRIVSTADEMLQEALNMVR